MQSVCQSKDVIITLFVCACLSPTHSCLMYKCAYIDVMYILYLLTVYMPWLFVCTFSQPPRNRSNLSSVHLTDFTWLTLSHYGSKHTMVFTCVCERERRRQSSVHLTMLLSHPCLNYSHPTVEFSQLDTQSKCFSSFIVVPDDWRPY